MDALLMVLRAFDAVDVPSQESGVDPVAQAEALSLELTVADSDIFDRRRQRLAKEATADPGLRQAAEAVAAAADHLASGHPLRSRSWSDEALGTFQDSSPLTLKPAVWAVNVDEDLADPSVVQHQVEEVVPSGDMVVVLSARLEEEGSRLTSEERLELFEGLGLGEGALAKVVAAAYRSLGLITFYTLGPKEAHAWTVRRGATAPVAAGKIHSDIERGFIRVEVTGIDQAIEAGGWDAAKRNGAVRVEGRTYQVKDGDVLVVRFSV
jgi:ribosome-binding ATPase YchF (GTP1/OBG family)